jgi:excisionase family DNA binding protein
MITIPINSNTGIRIPMRTPPEKPKKELTESLPQIGVSIPQAAKMLGVSKDTFLVLVKAGKVRTVRINKRVIVSIQSLREFVDGKGGWSAFVGQKTAFNKL